MSYPPGPPGPPYPNLPQPYGGFDPGAPWGRDAYGVPYSDKQKVTAGVLQLLCFFSVCGVGRLYAGHSAIGTIQLIGGLASIPLMFVCVGLVTWPMFLLWTLIDGIMILCGRSVDGRGFPLRP